MKPRAPDHLPAISPDGEGLITEPLGKKDLLAILAGLQPLDEEFLDVDEGLPPLKDVGL